MFEDGSPVFGKEILQTKKGTSEVAIHGGYLKWAELHNKKGVPARTPTIKSVGVRDTSFRIVYAYLKSVCALLFIEKIWE